MSSPFFRLSFPHNGPDRFRDGTRYGNGRNIHYRLDKAQVVSRIYGNQTKLILQWGHLDIIFRTNTNLVPAIPNVVREWVRNLGHTSVLRNTLAPGVVSTFRGMQNQPEV